MCNIPLGFEVPCSEPRFHCMRELSEARHQSYIYYKILNYRQNFSVNQKLYMGILLEIVHQTNFQI